MVIREQRFSFNQVRQVLGGVLEHDLHAKRVDSLCDATLGVLRSASLAVCAIGQGLAAARGLNPKHATKQVDRLLSNRKIDVDEILSRWVPYVIGGRTSIVAALDWTDFEADKQATIMLSLITDHGRATPLVWLTVDKRTLKDNRSLYEHRVLVRLAELLPAETKVCIVADRGFGDQKLYRMLTEELCFDWRLSASAATSPSPPRPARPAPLPPGCEPTEVPACCVAPRSPPIATGWAPWSACRSRTCSSPGAWPPAAAMPRPSN